MVPIWSNISVLVPISHSISARLIQYVYVALFSDSISAHLIQYNDDFMQFNYTFYRCNNEINIKWYYVANFTFHISPSDPKYINLVPISHSILALMWFNIFIWYRFLIQYQLIWINIYLLWCQFHIKF